MMDRRSFIGSLALLIASGCAQRSDWIEGTLVTVDVTGRWVGVGGFDMTLRQTGPKATGNVNVTGGNLWSGPIGRDRKRRRAQVQPARRGDCGAR